MNHVFIDRKERAGFASTNVSSRLNELRKIDQEADVISFVRGHPENGKFEKDRLDTWLRDNTAPA